MLTDSKGVISAVELLPSREDGPGLMKKREPKDNEVACQKCKLPLKLGQYKRIGTGVVCRDQPSCRQRVLSEELGIDLFTRYPRERTFFEMDVKPKNAKAGWRSISTDDERVMAAWVYFSWCYPAGYAYAVQLDLDDEVMHDRFGQPMVMTHDKLADLIGMHRPNVTRATSRLAARKRVRVDDGKVYPTAKPAITAKEREAALEPEAQLGEARNTIPRKYRHLLNDLLSDVAEESIRTEAMTEVLRSCTAYNEDHIRIRTSRDEAIEQVCTRLASLLSRPVTFKTKPRSSSSVGSPVHSTTQAPVSRGQAGESLNELYAAGMGKGALAKLPPVDERRKPRQADRPTEDDADVQRMEAKYAGKTDDQREAALRATEDKLNAMMGYKSAIRTWMEAEISIPGYDLEEPELDQIATTIQNAEHFEQFKAAARRQHKPRGWKVFVRIAQQCQARHGKYRPAADATAATESAYSALRRREIEKGAKGNG